MSATPADSKVVQPSETVPTANHQAQAAVNPEDVANSPRNQGVSSKKANGIADAVTARLNGQELTRKQRDILRSALDSPTVQSVISEFMQKKTDGLDSAQNHLYDKESINDGLTNEENAALRDHAYQRVGGDRSGVPGMLRGKESLPPEAFPATQRRELTAEENAFGANDYVTVTGDSTDSQVQTTVSGGSYEGGTDVIKTSLVNAVKDIRAIMPNTNLSKRGNVAVADVEIPGIKNKFAAHSKINTPLDKGANAADFSYLKPENERIFTSYVDDQYPRYHDTEAKILEDIASRITDPNVCGTINLYSELPCCQSCSNIILEFRRMFPNIKLNVFVE